MLDGYAAYRDELDRLRATGREVEDVGPDPLAADPAHLVAGRHGFLDEDERFLSAGLEMLRREHGED